MLAQSRAYYAADIKLLDVESLRKELEFLPPEAADLLPVILEEFLRRGVDPYTAW